MLLRWMEDSGKSWRVRERERDRLIDKWLSRERRRRRRRGDAAAAAARAGRREGSQHNLPKWRDRWIDADAAESVSIRLHSLTVLLRAS